jgi:hypothetical protein
MIREGEHSLPKWGNKTPNCIFAIVLIETYNDRSSDRGTALWRKISPFGRNEKPTRNNFYWLFQYTSVWKPDVIASSGLLFAEISFVKLLGLTLGLVF